MDHYGINRVMTSRTTHGIQYGGTEEAVTPRTVFQMQDDITTEILSTRIEKSSGNRTSLFHSTVNFNETIGFMTSHTTILNKYDDDIHYDETVVEHMTQRPLTQKVMFCLIIIQLCVGCYVFGCLVTFECRWKIVASSPAAKQARWLRIIALVASSSAITFYIVTLLSPVAVVIEQFCPMHFALQKTFYAVTLFTVYTFLWLRQKMFYSNPSLEYLYTGKLRCCSWVVLALIFICFSVQLIINIYDVIYMHVQYDKEDANNASIDTIKYVCRASQSNLWRYQVIQGALASIVAHLSLLCLFIYPLKRHKIETAHYFTRGANGSVVSRDQAAPLRGRTTSGGTSDIEVANGTLTEKKHARLSSKPSMGSNRSLNKVSSILSRQSDKKKTDRKIGFRLRKLIRRCFALTLICVASNVIVSAITVRFYQGDLLAPTLFGVNLVINLMCCIGCFSHWKQMVFPWRKRKFSKRKGGTASSTQKRSMNDQKLSDTIM